MSAGNPIADNFGVFESDAAKLNAALNPFDAIKKLAGSLPFWSSGARSFIRLGGKPLAVCTDFRWQVAYVATPIQTIDTPHAWDIDIGQATINASLNKFLDPTEGPEANGLFHIMQAAVHQPLVEMQVLDALGTSIFFARGMFYEVNGGVARGALTTLTAKFIGTVYQHYVTQQFKPYSLAATASGFIGNLQNLASTTTGGLL